MMNIEHNKQKTVELPVTVLTSSATRDLLIQQDMFY